MPVTLKDFWNGERARIGALLDQARQDVNTATADEAAASSAAAAAAAGLQAASARADAARRKLGGIPLPADGSPLLDELRQAVIDMRNAQAAAAQADVALRAARAVRARSVDAVAALAAAHAAVLARAALEARLDAQRQQWIAAAGSAPLKDLPAAAGAALATFEPPARANVEADYPAGASADADFLTRVRARRALAAGAAARARALAAADLATGALWEEATTRAAARVPALQRAFDAAAAALQEFAGATPQVQLALDQLHALANRTVAPMTDAEKKELNDPALKSARESALILLKGVDDAQSALFEARDTYTEALLDAQRQHPGKTEAELLAGDAALQAKFDAIATAAGVVTAAQGAFAPHLQELEAWFAAVPDAAWEQLETLDAAVALLARVRDTVPATLLAALDSAEAALTAQLEAAVAEQAFAATLAERLARDAAALAAAAETSQQRQLAVARFVAPL
jgi:hypothetical protein